MNSTQKQETILAAINARGWFTDGIYWNEAISLRDAGKIKLSKKYFVGGNRKNVWVAA